VNKIHLLPEDISQKIAAGEVIERPASVVKELVENSLDAGASQIKIELAEGGKKLIRVKDDGCGMSRKDALLSFERHSTSKIRREHDLEEIATLGFRGEALPSISAVSRMTLITFDGAEKRATRIDRKGEKNLHTQDAAFPKGTSVEVRDLFFNLPARKKFLRTERSELSQIVKLLTHFVLAYPMVKFSLQHGKRAVFDYPTVGGLKERIYQMHGKSVLDELMEIDFEEDGRRVSGYVSRPPSGRRDRSRQLFFVNRRPVRDRMLMASLSQAFKGYLEKDHFPQAYVFLQIPFSEVDVNVHPAKAEVRFDHSQSVFQLVQKGIAKAVARELGIKEIQPEEREKPTPSAEVPVRTYPGETRTPPLWKTQGERVSDLDGLFVRRQKEEAYPRVLGQYLDAYIVASDEEGLLVIDQHNAHERVLYEKYKQIAREKKWPRKLALLPILFEFSPSQEMSFEKHQELLEETGFRVENMGGRSYALKEYPDVFKEKEAKEIFLSLLEDVKEEGFKDKKEKILATMACKTAVKAGEPLPYEKMSYLVEELFKTSHPSLCPHGRPVLLKLDRKRIEKEIGRG
jgi:DNA mismatch repair protein MutL